MFLSDGFHPTHMAAAGGKFWILVDDQPIEDGTPGPEVARLLAIDPGSDEIMSEVSLDGSPSHLFADENAVWVAHWGTGAVTRIDPQTGAVMAEIRLELPFDFGNREDKRLFIPNDLALGHGSLWVGTARGALARIDVETNDVEIIELEPGARGEIAVDEDGVWIAEQVAGLEDVATLNQLAPRVWSPWQ
ncbi:MAG: hypothetical protein ACRDVL_00175 [Acidimicrobiia bacterium]